MQKDILGFEFNGTPGTHTVWLEETKRNKLLTILQGWLRGSRDGNHGIRFEEFESVAQKIRHAFTAIPAGKGLLSPLNAVVTAKPRFVFLHRNRDLFEAVSECRILLRESIAAPTRCKELVSEWPDFVGIVDASGQGVGGIIVSERAECVPTVFRMEWPDDVKKDIKSESNPEGRITNSDLEMAGLLLLWLVMEEVCGPMAEKHAALFSDNSPTVHWVRRMASRHSRVAARLIRALALRLKLSKASPLTPLQIAGSQNAIMDIPS